MVWQYTHPSSRGHIHGDDGMLTLRELFDAGRWWIGTRSSYAQLAYIIWLARAKQLKLERQFRKVSRQCTKQRNSRLQAASCTSPPSTNQRKTALRNIRMTQVIVSNDGHSPFSVRAMFHSHGSPKAPSCSMEEVGRWAVLWSYVFYWSGREIIFKFMSETVVLETASVHYTWTS